MNHSFTYHLNGTPVIVTGYYTPSELGDYENPPIRETFELATVEYKGIDISPILSSDQIFDIEQHGIETY